MEDKMKKGKVGSGRFDPANVPPPRRAPVEPDLPWFVEWMRAARPYVPYVLWGLLGVAVIAAVLSLVF